MRFSHNAHHHWYRVYLPAFFVTLVLVAFVAALWFPLRVFRELPHQGVAASTPDCPVRVEQHEVVGGSMAPRINGGDIVDIAFGNFPCLKLSRGDVAAISFPWRERAIIKTVVGFPGDSFALVGSSEGYHIAVNGETLKNSAGEPYLFTGSRADMLGLYVTDYGGVIPEDAYLVLGDLVGGSDDSTIFGLVDANRIVGRVLTE